MEKLFDETHEYGQNDFRRTIWYGYAENLFDMENISRFADIIKNEFSQPQLQAQNITEVHWVFYGAKTEEDAIGDKIRPSIMIRKKNNKFVSNCNISDCCFAAAFDNIYLFKSQFEERLS